MSILEKIVIALVVLGLAIGVSYGVGRRDGKNEATKDSIVRVDTLVVYDTITQYEPIYQEKRIIEKVYLPVEITDTIWKRDTLLVAMEREQLVWQDSLSLIYASGILPQIDSVRHFVKEIVVNREVSMPYKIKSRWGLGVQAGYGAYYDGKIRTAPYIGVGISYNILSW